MASVMAITWQVLWQLKGKYIWQDVKTDIKEEKLTIKKLGGSFLPQFYFNI